MNYSITLFKPKKKPLSVLSGFRFLHPNGLFSVYYLGVYMILGCLLFSVSATLKSVCTHIIAHKYYNVKYLIKFIF